MNIENPPDNGPDSGYPTPRDPEDNPISSRAHSPLNPITSTPIPKSRNRIAFRKHFESFHEDLSLIESSPPKTLHKESGNVVAVEPVGLAVIKEVLNLNKDLKREKRAHEKMLNYSQMLYDENVQLKNEVESFHSKSMLDQSHNQENFIPPSQPVFPLKFDVEDKGTQEDDGIHQQLAEFQEQWRIEKSEYEEKFNKMEIKPAVVITATAEIQVESDTKEVDAQTELDDEHQETIDDLTLRLERNEQARQELENRLYDFEQTKAAYEKKIAEMNEQGSEMDKRKNEKIEKLQMRLEKVRKDNEEVKAQEQNWLEREQKLNNEIEELRFQKDEAVIRFVDLGEKLEKQEKELEAMEEEKKAEIRLIENMEAEIEKLKQDAEDQLVIFENNILKLEEEQQEAEKAILAREQDVAEKEKAMKSIEKENENLITLKNDLVATNLVLETRHSELEERIRSTEHELASAKERLEEAQKSREQGEDERRRLVDLVKNRDDGSAEILALQEKNELMVKEIDYLRANANRKVDSTDSEMSELRKEVQKKNQLVEKLEDELNVLKKAETDNRKRIEDLVAELAVSQAEIVALKEKVEEKRNTITEIMENARNNMEMYGELKKEHENVLAEYQQFHENAQMQFSTEIGERDELIKDLRARLVQLEPYPGQNLPPETVESEVQTEKIDDVPKEWPKVEEKTVEMRNAETSTDETLENVSVCSTSSSGEIVQKLTQMANKLGQYRVNDDIAPAQEFRRLVVELLENSASDLSSPVASEVQASRFWDAVTKACKANEKTWKAKIGQAEDELEEARKEADALETKIRKVQLALSDAEADLRQEKDMRAEAKNEISALERECEKYIGLYKAKALDAETYMIAAEGFKEQFEMQQEDCKEYQAQTKQISDILGDVEKEAEDLRMRLETAEHNLEVRKRNEMLSNEDMLAENDRMRENLKRCVEERKYLLDEMNVLRRDTEILLEKKRKENEHLTKTCSRMTESHQMDQDRIKELRLHNRKRQKIIDYVNGWLTKFLSNGGDVNTLREEILNMTQQIGGDSECGEPRRPPRAAPRQHPPQKVLRNISNQ